MAQRCSTSAISPGAAAAGAGRGRQLFPTWRDNADALGNDKDALIRITDEFQRLRLTARVIVNGLR